MSLENVKVGDWIKVQVTDIKSGDLLYPIECGEDCCFTMEGEYSIEDGQIAFPIEEPDPQGKWMMVSDDNKNWSKRKVLMEKNGYFFYWHNAVTDEEVEIVMGIGTAKYVKEIEEPVDYNGDPVQDEHELTLDEWAEKLKPYLKPKKEKE